MGATFTKTITADGNHKLADIDQAPAGVVSVRIASGSATYTLKYSPDGGNTFIDMKDSSGSAFTGTEDAVTAFQLARGRSNSPGAIYINVTSASGLSLVADLVVN